jgi:hypothetical protein
MIIDPANEETLQAILMALGGGGGSTPVAEYDSVTGVAASGSQTIVSYTVPVGDTFNLSRISVSGDNIAEFTVNINGSPIATKRSWFTDYNVEFIFESSSGSGPAMNAGDTVNVVVNNFRPTPGDFNGTILGRLE